MSARTFPPEMPKLEVGDHVRVTISGRTGWVVARCKPARDGWLINWDEPVYGVEHSRVATVNLERVSAA